MRSEFERRRDNEMTRLTKAKIKALTKAGRHGDGNGLYLFVASGGSKSWVQRLVIQGKRRDLGLGGWPQVSLEDARLTAAYNRRQARVYKVDPTQAPMQADPIGPGPMDGNGALSAPEATVPTFKDCSLQFLEERAPEWKTPAQGANFHGLLKNYAFPILGSMPVDQITGQDVLKCLKPMWRTKPDLARRLRQRIRAVLGWCLGNGYVTSNAAGDGIDGALPHVKNGGSKHYRALHYSQVAGALATVEGTRASESTKLSLRFLVLTATRSGEARGARWSEIDLEGRRWTIAAERMKTGIEHRVPLSDEAMEVLQAAKALADGSGLVFPSARGGELSDMTWTKLLRSAGLAKRATVHGFRSSFRDWCAESGQDRAIAEAALAHVVAGVEGAYFRSDLFEQRRAVMQSWGRYLTA